MTSIATNSGRVKRKSSLLIVKKTVQVGRLEHNHIEFIDKGSYESEGKPTVLVKSISRDHLEFIKSFSGWRVKDVGSLAGTFLRRGREKIKLEKGKKVKLKEKDKLCLAFDDKLTFLVVDV